ncbi:AraC family transcriptional regulator [Frigidibacter sp. ROC022]|uniref:AraC family transcriptional regulator n=1 Tax=Frigidibacter sp. ROC022 TaxID=2971796 RepID=UPI00215ADFF1|nr:helix-turn-helix domain-containing protein [Frigidibacter sp. ROC022]MCR8725750.1 helix-turn-helix domain-containing protein [Frigidibacter sp. ROC022]
MSHAIAVCHGAFGRAALYQLDKTIITHAHREGHLVFYVEGAPAEVEVVGKRHRIVSGTGVAVSPWEPHSFHVPEGETTFCLVLYIKPMWFLENSSSAEFALKFGKSALPITTEIRDGVHRLTALLLENEHQARFNAALYSLTRECFDMSWIGAPLAGRAQAYRRFSDFRVRRALRLFQESFAQDIEMESLARSVGLSRPHFFKLFKQYMGVTPNVYMNTLRSEHALDDLLRTPKTVTDIAFDLGFSSQASFTRFFSSNVGIAPSEYRRVAHVTDRAFPMMGERNILPGMPTRA